MKETSQNTEFEFNGDWELEYTFKSFEGLQSRRGAYTSLDKSEASNGDINLIIEDELNETPDLKQSQINAINYMSNNPNEIRLALLKALEKHYPSQKEIYGYDPNDPDYQTWFPEIRKLSDFASVFGIGNVFILIEDMEGFAYVGLEGGCSWDEEHGIGFLLHKDRVVNISTADIAFNSWEASKDNGTYEQKKLEWKESNSQKRNVKKPVKYKPHPKYGKLKPSQISENKMYENRLIERGFNDEFIALVKSGEIDINVNPGLSTSTYLRRAAQFNNIEACKFLFEAKPNDISSVIQHAASHRNRQLVNLCLKNGININEVNDVNQTLFELAEGNYNYALNNKPEEAEVYKEFLEFIIELGAKRRDR
ncbi:MAG: hypothetical protein AAFN93_22925 [Bacteroidota bacterium]